jgi:hypothetical protein
MKTKMKKVNGVGLHFQATAGNCWPGPKAITTRPAHVAACGVSAHLG